MDDAEKFLCALFLPSADIPGYYRLKRCLSDFARIRTPMTSILDAGCGAGAKSVYFAHTHPGIRVVGADVQPDPLRYAERLKQKFSVPNATFVRRDLVNSSDLGRFDFIVTSDVLEHFEEDGRYAANLDAMLNPGGHIHINTPAKEHGYDFSELSPAAQEDLRRWMKDVGHVRLGYTPEELKALFPNCDLVSMRKIGNSCTKLAYFFWEKTILDPQRTAPPPWRDYTMPLFGRIEALIERHCVARASAAPPAAPRLNERMFLQAIRTIDLGIELEEKGALDPRYLLEEELCCLLRKP
ncbi:MAG: class I SAM-dependent methyltransferase [Chlamydiota bacterium]